MKILNLALVLMLMIGNSSVAIGQSYGQSNAPPFREVGGHYYDLRTLIAWHCLPDRKRDVTKRPLEEWKLVIARVSRVHPNGCVVEFTGNRYAFVTNYPNFKDLAEGVEIVFMGMKTGTHIFTNAEGNERHLELYDFGNVFSPAQRAAEARSKNLKTNSVPERKSKS